MIFCSTLKGKFSNGMRKRDRNNGRKVEVLKNSFINNDKDKIIVLFHIHVNQ
jgi:hypothetical protein